MDKSITAFVLLIVMALLSSCCVPVPVGDGGGHRGGGHSDGGGGGHRDGDGGGHRDGGDRR